MADVEDLTQLHLADLRARAAEAGVNGYRMLRREELIAELQAGGTRKRSRWPRRKAPAVDTESETDELKVVTEDRDPAQAEAKPQRRRGRRGGRGRGGAGRERLSDDAAPPARRDDDAADSETEEVTGILEITRQRHGFLSVEGSDDDVYVSASQVRRCEMKDGDQVTGPVRAPRRGERHRALVRVNLVNGEEPVEAPKKKVGRKRDVSEGIRLLTMQMAVAGSTREEIRHRLHKEFKVQHADQVLDEILKSGGATPRTDPFDGLTPAVPSRRIELPANASALVRAADLLAPLARGQRVLVKAAPRSGRTTFLRGLAQALSRVDDLELRVLLVDERPEEVPEWNEIQSADLALASADLSPSEQVEVAHWALERARMQAVEGADVVLLCDSLSRLAVAAEGVGDVKRLFASGRELAEEGAGSLTVVATTLEEGEDDGSAQKAVTTTETSLLTLDASLASEGISPALRFTECRAVGEDKILSEEEMDGLRNLRTQLAQLVAPEAAGFVRRQLEGANSNAKVLRALA